MRLCRLCNVMKPLDDFYLRKTGKHAGKYVSRCKSCCAIVAQEWKLKHPVQYTQMARKANTKYSSTHREARRVSCREWRLRNPDYVKAAEQARFRTDSETVLAKNRAYHARRRNAPGKFTASEWLEKIAEYDGRCAYCREVKKLTVHHVVPLSKGGTNYIQDVVPACRSCNSKIGTTIVWPNKEVSCHKH